MDDRSCVAFLRWAAPRLGLRWEGFRRVRRQACKRIARRMRALGLGDVAAYRGYLEAHAQEWAAVDAALRITISRFWRDRGVWQALACAVLPALAAAAQARGATRLRAWSAGCASGEEPYSLVLYWRLGWQPPADLDIEVVATDADPHLIERARAAVYQPGSLRELPAGWREAAFEAVDGQYGLRPEFRRPVRFLVQDIRRALPAGPFDLVLCRNLVLTYFADDLVRAVLARIARRLVPGGALVIGAHERLPAGVPGFEAWPGAAHVLRRLGDQALEPGRTYSAGASGGGSLAGSGGCGSA